MEIKKAGYGGNILTIGGLRPGAQTASISDSGGKTLSFFSDWRVFGIVIDGKTYGANYGTVVDAGKIPADGIFNIFYIQSCGWALSYIYMAFPKSQPIVVGAIDKDEGYFSDLKFSLGLRVKFSQVWWTDRINRLEFEIVD